MSKVIKVGAAQISPKFFDKQQTLEKTCQYIKEGGKLGLDLLERYNLSPTELEALLESRLGASE